MLCLSGLWVEAAVSKDLNRDEDPAGRKTVIMTNILSNDTTARSSLSLHHHLHLTSYRQGWRAELFNMHVRVSQLTTDL